MDKDLKSKLVNRKVGKPDALLMRVGSLFTFGLMGFNSGNFTKNIANRYNYESVRDTKGNIIVLDLYVYNQ